MNGVREGTVEGVSKGDRKRRGEKVDVELQAALGVEAMNSQGSSAAAGRADKIEAEGPDGEAVE